MTYFLLILAITVIARIPIFLCREIYNSDHAFIGLQAIRQLKGEWFWSLWGSTYQGPLEAQVISLLIPVFGISNLTLALCPLIAFFICLWFCFKIFSEHTTPFKVFLLLLFLAVGSRIFMVQQVVPYRQWTILFIFLALYFALRKKSLTKTQSFLMGFSPFFGYYTDNFVIQFIPAILACSYIRNYFKERSTFLFLGSLTGVVFVIAVSKLMPEGMGAPVSFSFRFPNARLFFAECLPEIFGFSFVPLLVLGYFAFKSTIIVFKETSLELRLSFLFGLLTIITCTVGFCGKHIIMDKHAVRYLTPLVYAIPFVLLPYFSQNTRKDVLILIPYFVGILILSFSEVLDWKDLKFPSSPSYEFWYKMQPWLQENRIVCGYSNYWIAYQYTFLSKEKVIVVPREKPFTGPDRYLPYRKIVSKCPLVVEIFLPREQELKESLLKQWRAKKWVDNIFESEQYTAIVRKNL